MKKRSRRSPVLTDDIILQKGKKKRRSSAVDHDVHSLKTKKSEQDLPGEDAEEAKNKEEEEEAASNRRMIIHGYHSVEVKMEDYIVAETRRIDGHDLGLYAIFDGHSGRDVAKYLQSHLFDNILSEPDFWTNPNRAIKRAYKETDEEILEVIVGSRGGSTAVTAIVIDGEKLIVANVGDCRAIICSKTNGVKQISVDHEPEMEKEVVASKGGFVSEKRGNDVPRVDGQLAMTRAFGDRKLKQHITSEPDVKMELIDEDTEFIVLASDGLWKVMSNEDVFECIKNITDAQEGSEELIKEALSRKSKDDISCILVSFI